MAPGFGSRPPRGCWLWRRRRGSPPAFYFPSSVGPPPGGWLLIVPPRAAPPPCFSSAVRRPPAAPAALLQGCTPLLIVLGSAFLPGERPHWWHWIGAAVGMAGTVALIGVGNLSGG